MISDQWMRIREAQKHIWILRIRIRNTAKNLMLPKGLILFAAEFFFCPKPAGKSSLESATHTLTLHEGLRRILNFYFAKNTSFTKRLILFAAVFFLSQAGRKI
jgi:hypothetical protein